MGRVYQIKGHDSELWDISLAVERLTCLELSACRLADRGLSIKSRLHVNCSASVNPLTVMSVKKQHPSCVYRCTE